MAAPFNNRYNTFGANQKPPSAPEFQAERQLFKPGKRQRLNVVAIAMNIFVPSMVYAACFCGLSFLLYKHIYLAYGIVALCLLLTCSFALLARRTKLRDHDPTWYMYSAIAVLLATIGGSVLGEVNFRVNVKASLDLDNLTSYSEINPAKQKGQELMDSGRVYFSSGTHLETSKAMAFKNSDMYCVVPIVWGQEALASYDYWAVGINCCDGKKNEFRCGEYGNPHARSGLRLMEENQRPFFQLAVQQAQAAYNMRSNHPLFFTWMQNPDHASDAYRSAAIKFTALSCGSFFFLNFFGVLCAVVGFSRIGKY